MAVTADRLLELCTARSIAATSQLDYVSSPWVAFKVAHRAERVAAFVTAWGLALEELDGGASHAAVERQLNESRATFYRRLADFRELFEEHDDPAELLASLKPRRRQSMRADFVAKLAG